VPLRPGDVVGFIGGGPPPTPESWTRHDPEGAPRPGDYGDVLEVDGEMALVSWRFGATTECPIEHLSKEPRRAKSHRYRVVFESFRASDDVVYSVVTECGEAKAVWMASSALLSTQPNFRPWTVEVEDLGTDFELDPEDDLISYDELA
jgi:hypothetical protein